MTQIAGYTAKKVALITLLFMFVLSVATPFIPTAKATTTYQYSLNGPVNEADFVYLTGDVNVTAHFASGAGADEAFFFNHAYLYNCSYPVRFFTFQYNNTSTDPAGVIQERQYWLDPVEQQNNTSTIWTTFSPTDPTTYVISFMDQVGMLKTYPYVEAQIFVLGTYHTIEKRLVDSQNIVVMNLLVGGRYSIVYTDGVTQNIHGDLTTTATTGIQLVIRGVDFPKETLLLYQYVHASAIRDFLTPTGAITISYEDLTSKTTSFTITITDASDGSIAYGPTTYTVQTFSYTWNNVPNATSYQITVAIDHQTFGSFNYKYYLQGEYEKASAPFDLSFLGSSMGISTAMLIPALLIIFVAGCFSELTAETAAVLTVIIAIILSALGWIEISQAAIITALSLSVLAGIVTARRRMQTY